MELFSFVGYNYCLIKSSLKALNTKLFLTQSFGLLKQIYFLGCTWD